MNELDKVQGKIYALIEEKKNSEEQELELVRNNTKLQKITGWIYQSQTKNDTWINIRVKPQFKKEFTEFCRNKFNYSEVLRKCMKRLMKDKNTEFLDK